MCALLPDDILIAPNPSSADGECKSQALDSIAKESSIAVDSIHELTYEPKENDTGTANKMKSWDGDGIKKFFAEKRRLSHINVDISQEKYRLFVSKSETASLQTDEYMIKMLETT